MWRSTAAIFSSSKTVTPMSIHQKQAVTPTLEIWDYGNDYKSLHVRQDMAVSSIISPIGYQEVFEQADRYTVQMGKAQHISLAPNYLQYINHSCQPNVFFDLKNMQIIALRPILVGEELSFFYPSTEWKMREAFECNCGQPNCLGQIQGAAYLADEVLNRYRLSAYIVEEQRNRA